MDAFLADYDDGRRERRYVNAALPSLPFADGAFDKALCSHFLFLYSQQFTLDFHIAAIQELRRVAREVRVFPLLALGGQPSAYVGPTVEELRRGGDRVSIEVVPYEFQRGGNQMMRVMRA